MASFVRFWGTRGSIPTPGHKTRVYGGNTSCVEVRIDDTLFICDGGTGMRELGDSLLRRSDDPVEAHLLFSFIKLMFDRQGRELHAIDDIPIA